MKLLTEEEHARLREIERVYKKFVKERLLGELVDARLCMRFNIIQGKHGEDIVQVFVTLVSDGDEYQLGNVQMDVTPLRQTPNTYYVELKDIDLYL